MLVEPKYYVRYDSNLKRSVPFPEGLHWTTLKDEKGNVVPVEHIVVVTGYDDKNVYINDPLAVKQNSSGVYVRDDQVGKNFAVPVDQFKTAAKESGRYMGLVGANEAGWYGAAVTRK
jgi:hypothetical protein